MEKSRSILELLELLLKEILDGNLRTGMCGIALHKHLHNNMTDHEYFNICAYISNSRPGSGENRAYFWPIGNDKPRIEWLNRHILLNTSKDGD